MIGSGFCEKAEICRLKVVSILVVLDDWFGLLSCLAQNPMEWFQSLLFWMIGSGLPLPLSLGLALQRVSILVVLDDWFGPR